MTDELMCDGNNECFRLAEQLREAESQASTLRQERDRQAHQIELMKRAEARWLPCPDCRDKIEPGDCQRCARQRVEAKLGKSRAECTALRAALEQLIAKWRSEGFDSVMYANQLALTLRRRGATIWRTGSTAATERR